MSIEKNISELEKELPKFGHLFKINVWQILKEEREYQEQIWNENTTETKGIHTAPEWLTFIREYLNEAGAHMSRQPDPQATIMAANCLRKVAAMVLAATEQLSDIEEFCLWSEEDENTDIFEEFVDSKGKTRNYFDEDEFISINEKRTFAINSINELVAFCIGQNNQSLNKYSTSLSTNVIDYQDNLWSILYAYLCVSSYLNIAVPRSEYENMLEESYS